MWKVLRLIPRLNRRTLSGFANVISTKFPPTARIAASKDSADDSSEKLESELFDVVLTETELAELIGSLDDRNTDFLTRFVRATLPDYLRRWWGVSDVVQSVILRLYRHRERWQAGTQQQFEAWAVNVAKNRIADGIRRYRLNARFLSMESGRQTKHRNDLQNRLPVSSFDQAAVNEQTEQLLAAIQALPTEVQEVVLLRYVHDLTFQQISNELNLPVTTCRRRWQEGCLELGQKLKNYF